MVRSSFFSRNLNKFLVAIACLIVMGAVLFGQIQTDRTTSTTTTTVTNVPVYNCTSTFNRTHIYDGADRHRRYLAANTSAEAVELLKTSINDLYRFLQCGIVGQHASVHMPAKVAEECGIYLRFMGYNRRRLELMRNSTELILVFPDADYFSSLIALQRSEHYIQLMADDRRRKLRIEELQNNEKRHETEKAELQAQVEANEVLRMKMMKEAQVTIIQTERIAIATTFVAVVVALLIGRAEMIMIIPALVSSIAIAMMAGPLIESSVGAIGWIWSWMSSLWPYLSWLSPIIRFVWRFSAWIASFVR